MEKERKIGIWGIKSRRSAAVRARAERSAPEAPPPPLDPIVRYSVALVEYFCLELLSCLCISFTHQRSLHSCIRTVSRLLATYNNYIRNDKPVFLARKLVIWKFAIAFFLFNLTYTYGSSNLHTTLGNRTNCPGVLPPLLSLSMK